ncbi:hypothetical protein [Methylocystis iwaonis]|uniref:hypothetical protein n=1 Tax=Methylocystis iwaonis TaxID=2885079 RepID=UPI002E7ACFF2|nr:hypothetical protein [Methylocystis iwaonis]
MSGPAQQLATRESRRAAAADLCARVWRDLGALRHLCEEAGLDAQEDFLGEMASDFDKLATRLAETARPG